MPPPPPPPDARITGLTLALLMNSCGASADDAARDAPAHQETDPAAGAPMGPPAAADTDAGETNGTSGDPTPAGESVEGGGVPATPAGGTTAGVDETPTGTGTLPSNVEPSVTPSTPPMGGEAPTLSRCSFGEVGTSAAARTLMTPFAVRHGDFARSTIYSWTTAEQIEELRADPTLLTRSMTAEGERGRAADVLSTFADQDEFAALLEQPQFQKRRFGWSNPWATLLGWDTENYGNHLLEIRLAQDAWLASIIVGLDGRLSWEFADVNGNPIEPQQVLDHPERLAAAYFVDLRDQGCGTLGATGALFREYFVFNEAMIESWSAYTPQIRETLDQGVAAIQALLAEIEAANCDPFEWCVSEWVAADWAGETDGPTSMATLYLAALAFPNPQYEPRTENLNALLKALDGVPFAEPLRHER